MSNAFVNEYGFDAGVKYQLRWDMNFDMHDRVIRVMFWN